MKINYNNKSDFEISNSDLIKLMRLENIRQIIYDFVESSREDRELAKTMPPENITVPVRQPNSDKLYEFFCDYFGKKLTDNQSSKVINELVRFCIKNNEKL